MKQKISQSFQILHWFWSISIAVILCTLQISAQQGQQTPPEFPVGVFSTSDLFHTYQTAYEKLFDLGVNYVINQARSYTYTNAQPFNLIAHNTSSPEDRIYHYTNGMFKRWEAENEQVNTLATGILHRFGQKDFWKGDSCWSTGEAYQAQDELIYGPHYSQDKKYFLLYQVNPYDPDNKVDFTATFRIAYTNIPWNPENIEVCRLLVVHRMMIMLDGEPTGEYTVDTLAIRPLLVEEFPTDSFYTFNLQYSYADSLLPPDKRGEGMISPAGITYEDTYSNTGIEFRVDWAGVGKLYVDYAEVCDDYIWDFFRSNQQQEINVLVTGLGEYPPKGYDGYRLLANYPNPFNPSTKIPYRLKEAGHVRLSIYDLKGELVRVLVNEWQERGYYEVVSQPSGEDKKRITKFEVPMGKTYSPISSGMYIYSIQVIDERNIPVFTDSEKMILLK